MIQNIGHHLCMIPKRASKCGEINFLLENFQEKFEWIEEPVDKTIKQGSLDEVTFACKLSHKGKKAKWYLRNQVRNEFLFLFFPKVYLYVVVICLQEGAILLILEFLGNFICIARNLYLDAVYPNKKQ